MVGGSEVHSRRGIGGAVEVVGALANSEKAVDVIIEFRDCSYPKDTHIL